MSECPTLKKRLCDILSESVPDEAGATLTYAELAEVIDELDAGNIDATIVRNISWDEKRHHDELKDMEERWGCKR